MSEEQENVREAVRKGYGAIAAGTGSCCGASSSCCGGGPSGVAKAVGYSDAELATLPEGADMGLSCGNPTALAELHEGEAVLDLGAGGGFDAFLVTQRVGTSGHVIGVDMTPEMVSKARRNAIAFSERTGLRNVEFRLGEIEHLPVADTSVDVVISNCVINLSPDKPQVWREAFRVLRPGGRLAVSDLALLKPLPESVRAPVEALVGCIAGAVLVTETESMLVAAGFTDIRLEMKTDYVNAMSEWRDPLYLKIIELLPPGEQLGDYLTSLCISARKGL